MSTVLFVVAKELSNSVAFGSFEFEAIPTQCRTFLCNCSFWLQLWLIALFCFCYVKFSDISVIINHNYAVRGQSLEIACRQLVFTGQWPRDTICAVEVVTVSAVLQSARCFELLLFCSCSIVHVIWQVFKIRTFSMCKNPFFYNWQ